MPGQQLSVPPVGDIESEYLYSDEYQAKLTEKLKKLEECLPNLEKGLDTVSMLKEAKKYVAFLQAQEKALEAMPSHSTRAYPPAQASDGGAIDSLALLKKLSQNQMLQLMINSPKFQQKLSSSGTSIFYAGQEFGDQRQ